MDKNKQAALARALEQINSGSSHKVPVKVVMCGESDEAPKGLKIELEEIIGREVDVVWRKITKRDIPLTNTGDITDGVSAESRYYEDAARRGARTGD